MTNKPRGTLYIGVTSDIARRVYEHKEKMVKGFTTRYNLELLVFWQGFDTIEQAYNVKKR